MKPKLQQLRLTILIVAFFSLSINLLGQRLKQVSENLALGIKESYTVLKSDRNIKHGEYFQILQGDTIVFGEYIENKKSGTWKYLNYRNEIVFVYDFTLSKVIDWKCEPKNQTCRDCGSAAAYSLGNFAAKANIGSRLEYPEVSAENNIQGSPIVYFVINDEGKLEKVFVGKSSGVNDIDNAALKAAENSCTEEWIPAYDCDGRAVQDTIFFKLNFVL